MLTPQRTTWFLVVDGARMQLFESSGVKDQWSLVKSQEMEEARKASRELGRERPGRGHKVGPDSRFSVGSTEPHEKKEAEFLASIAENVNKAAQEDQFDQIVVAAPPQALGKLRAKFQPQVTKKYVGVFDKDLTNMPETELFNYFKERLHRW